MPRFLKVFLILIVVSVFIVPLPWWVFLALWFLITILLSERA